MRAESNHGDRCLTERLDRSERGGGARRSHGPRAMASALLLATLAAGPALAIMGGPTSVASAAVSL